MNDKIINFETFKILKDTDPDQTFVAPDGSRWFKYFFNYDFDCREGGFGVSEHILNNPNIIFPDKDKIKQYEVYFWAQNDKEAEERMEAIKKTATWGGRILAEIDL